LQIKLPGAEEVKDIRESFSPGHKRGLASKTYAPSAGRLPMVFAGEDRLLWHSLPTVPPGPTEGLLTFLTLHHVGGDADNGRRLFFYKQELSCLRCHKVNGEGGEVGPEMKGIGTRQKRDYLLESIVDPNKQIAKGYDSVLLVLNNGQTRAGVLKGEDAKEIRLMTAEGKLVTVAKDEVDERHPGKSAMPEDVIKKLSKSELRDLVEFLAGLKEKQ
jgi:putative heme-binding domain-containing protein